MSPTVVISISSWVRVPIQQSQWNAANVSLENSPKFIPGLQRERRVLTVLGSQRSASSHCVSSTVLPFGRSILLWYSGSMNTAKVSRDTFPILQHLTANKKYWNVESCDTTRMQEIVISDTHHVVLLASSPHSELALFLQPETSMHYLVAVHELVHLLVTWCITLPVDLDNRQLDRLGRDREPEEAPSDFRGHCASWEGLMSWDDGWRISEHQLWYLMNSPTPVAEFCVVIILCVFIGCFYVVIRCKIMKKTSFATLWITKSVFQFIGCVSSALYELNAVRSWQLSTTKSLSRYRSNAHPWCNIRIAAFCN